MFYTFNGKMQEISAEEINENQLTAGYVSARELEEIYTALGFAYSTVQSCKSVSKHFRSGVEVYDSYTFTELKIANFSEDFQRDDCVAIYFKKNLFLVVDVEDYDGSTRQKFEGALKRYPADNTCLEKIVYAFFDQLIANDFKYIEDTGNEIAALEEDVLNDYAPESFNIELLHLKKELLTMHNYYEQLFDITDAAEENENEIFDDEYLMYIANLSGRIVRLREDTDSLSASVTHLQDAYSSYLDLKLNNTMKVFTVITSIFFPLTVIVGWYGMNFNSMPEFGWKYGYVYVIALSVAVVAALVIIGKKKKWF
ncbi:MAG: hypothetical protein IJL63_04840 [Clostridia bacterium]|nr:hypothetical protein [Clostridia bacterium]